MASPQLENGYTSIANEILDNLCKLSLNGTELKVVICIFRYTFGFRRKSHKLSASFISRYGNCELSSVKRALKRLQEKKIVVCVNPEKKGVKWKELGYKVKHGASALFGCSLIWGSRGDGATYKASFFGKSQVEAI